MARVRRSAYDGEILRLALPALGALAAEPLYLLVDTAIVGHLGTPQLAALALAATVLSNLVALCIFLTYGTTARVTRLHGAGLDAEAAALGPQAFWLALAAGVALTAVVAALAEPLVHALGGEGHVADLSARYLRGVSNLRRPLVIVVAANVLNIVLELLFVYGFDWGIRGSAWGTAIAQLGMGVAFVVELLRPHADTRRPRLAEMRPMLRIGRQIFVRTIALTASFLLAASLLARVGDAPLGAHQIAIQLFFFLALVLDAVAIAGQVIVGRMLGGGDAAGAHDAALRMIGWSVAVGAVFAVVLLATGSLLPRVFTGDAAVLYEASLAWPYLAVMQPLCGAVFALDGILIGAGDTRYLMWGMLAAAAVYIPIALLTLHRDWGILGVWWGLVALIAVRLVTCGIRFAGSHWALTGAPA